MKFTRHGFVLGCWLAASGALWAQAETALLADGAVGGGFGNGSFFYLLEVDGKPEAHNALRAMRQASYGRGAHMVVVPVARPVPAGKVTLKLRAEIATAAPIMGIVNLFRRGSDPLEIEGTVQLDLQDRKSVV